MLSKSMRENLLVGASVLLTAVAALQNAAMKLQDRTIEDLSKKMEANVVRIEAESFKACTTATRYAFKVESQVNDLEQMVVISDREVWKEINALKKRSKK